MAGVSDGERQQVAAACRILAMEGLVEGILGHVSVRTGPDSMLIRCRGPLEQGLLFTETADVKLVDLGGAFLEDADGYRAPNELPIHGEVLRARPEVNAIVHAHPPDVVLCSITALPLRPVFGSFNIPAMRLAGRVPTYDFAGLVRTRERGKAMADVLGDSPACVLRGHGLTAVGETLAQAVMRALNLDALARMTVAVAGTGRAATEVTAADLEDLPDLGSAFNDEAAWRYLVAKARRQGLL